MGNNLIITDGQGNHVATASLGLGCAVYFDHLAHKYDPRFNLFGPVETINQRLEPIYATCKEQAPWDYVVMLLFMNAHTIFKPSDLPHFERAIADFPPTFSGGPLRVITKFTALLREHGELHVDYADTTVDITVRDSNGAVVSKEHAVMAEAKAPSEGGE